MSVGLLWTCAGLLAVAVILLIVVLLRLSGGNREGTERAVRDELRSSREEAANSARDLRSEVTASMKASSELLHGSLDNVVNLQKAQLEDVKSQLDRLTQSNLSGMEQLRGAVNEQLQAIQAGNEKKLEEMRNMVDEKLQSTLQRRLGESFKLVSEQLEAVHRGLGEMQSLATGVGDLKRVLTNVKARGVWGEIQLGAILEQMLTPDQFACNVALKDETRDFVEYAVRLPGPGGESGSCVWLPIDSKFPQEDYLRLVEASAAADADAAQKAARALYQAACQEAQKIRDKYLDPPRTTDFAVMFLPTESLFAEIIRQPGLVEELHQKYRVVVAGPTTLSALLNSLRMGFRTLAIEKRASEVWTILAAVKTEFSRFGDTLAKVQKQLQTVNNTIEETGRRTRAMERKLKGVEELPAGEASALLSLSSEDAEENSSE